MASVAFQVDLQKLINKYNVENDFDMPDYLMAEMIVKFIETMGDISKRNLDWHGCNSICHLLNRKDNK